MEQQTIEGTWEEILQHSAELAGQRVRLTVLPGQSSNFSTTETLDQKLKGRVGRVYFQPSDLSERVEEAFTELLDALISKQKHLNILAYPFKPCYNKSEND